MFLLSFSDLLMIMIYVIKNCDVLMTADNNHDAKIHTIAQA